MPQSDAEEIATAWIKFPVQEINDSQKINGQYYGWI